MKANLKMIFSVLTSLLVTSVAPGGDSLERRADTPTPTVSPSPSPASFCDAESSCSSPPTDEKAIRQMELWLFLYDLDGENGGFLSIDARAIIPEGEYSEYQFKGATAQQSPFLGWGIDTAKANGTPFLFRVYSPQFGSILGFSRVGVGWPAFFHIPVEKSEVGLPSLHSEPESASPDPLMDLGISSPLIADDHSQPTFSTFASVLPDNMPLVTTATAIYEEGNALRDVGEETRQFGTATINTFSSLGAFWGNYPDSWLYSTVAGFSKQNAPIGPLRVGLQCEGYGSDEVGFVGANRMFYMWYPLLSPPTGESNQSGPTPSELMNMIALIPEEGDFIRETALREKLLGQSRLFTNLTKAADVNGDGCLDVADFQVVVDRTAEQGR